MTRKTNTIMLTCLIAVATVLFFALSTVVLITYAEGAASLAPNPYMQFVDANGDPYVGGQLYTYETGTTTGKTTWEDSAKATANANPIVLDSRGGANIFIDSSDGAYRFKLDDSDDTTIFTVDGIEGSVSGVISVAATVASLGTGATDGALKIDAGTGNLYTWDDDNSKWRVQPGNFYTTANLPTTATYTIETGCTVFDTTQLRNMYWNGTAWTAYTDTQYDTIYIDAAAMMPRTTNGAEANTNEYATNDIMKDYYAFDSGSTPEGAQITMVMPENWDLGTVKFKFYWSSATGSSTSDTANWLIAAVAVSNDDAMDVATGAAVTVSDAILANNGADLQITDATGALTVAGTPAEGDLVTYEIQRHTMSNTHDTMAEDAWLFGVVLKYGISGDITTW